MNSLKALLLSNPKAELAKRNFLDFVNYVKPGYQENWHHALLASYLQKFVKGEIKRLMVFMPPQHGKSELVSRNLPAFILGKNPKAKVVLASYSSDLASSFNRDCQRIIESQEYADVFPQTFLNTRNVVTTGSWLKNVDIFETVGHGGFLKSTGVGGSLTGTPADFAIIDDPVKDSVEAMSATYQYRNWNWYTDVLYSRIHNNTGILITQTRWNENDLSGLLLKKMAEGTGDQFTVISLPAIRENDYNPEDPRQPGEALWPERHNLEKLERVRSQSIRTFQSLYQQNPKPVQAGGEFYKGFDVTRQLGNFEYNPAIPLHLSFDFNVNPYMTCTVWQIINKTAYQVMEICLRTPNNRTSSLCKEIVRRFGGHGAGMFIYGDPSGVKQDTRTEQGSNDFTIIMDQLVVFRPKLRVAKAAPGVVLRADFINSIFESGYDGITLGIDSRCTHTSDDYLYLKEDSDGTKKKEKVVDPATGIAYEKYGHTSDANDYFICEAFKESFKKFQSKNKSTLSSQLGNFQ
jgi:hypothetical protein